eukprot:TRINITY_DN2266_c0_g1_i11.p3 TRINITY_DN2266_c0_g1~~TRINITY_DN2266_c0_g1_i11.p3  ORF type:complete len:109 (+),score=10.10 TRINITY_DN2266_c0_g1_i11:70-396(+)
MCIRDRCRWCLCLCCLLDLCSFFLIVFTLGTTGFGSFTGSPTISLRSLPAYFFTTFPSFMVKVFIHWYVKCPDSLHLAQVGKEAALVLVMRSPTLMLLRFFFVFSCSG